MYSTVTDRYAHTAQLVNPSLNFRAVFQSSSWGSAPTTAYTTVSADMDRIVFDHDLLICQSQSNAGTRNSRPQAWAKNVVSVSGQYHRNTLARTDDAWSSGALIGPAADGRLKPDLSHCYDQINTTSSASATSYTSTFGGTSGATPITCGNFGLLFQMWADGVFAGSPGLGRDVFDSRPHAATAKALRSIRRTSIPLAARHTT
ncbi:S8 family serine peptidase [Allorhizocola rhizosphaerae]|uniref:S8 family serine peptidase n=1 Tax=Allorhizocola rhizosphaerae TaxID=1872709 RepID=UPI001FE6D498|nr:S8 family serine peptidase [Allorhizocola rhizosphaerae]